MSRLPSRLTLAITLLLATLWWSTGTILPARAATDTVTNCTSDANLRSVINNAAAGDTVTFNCGGTIVQGSQGRIYLTKNLTIDGSGQAVTLDGGGINGNCGYGMFSIGDFDNAGNPLNASVTLRNLTITNCSSGGGVGGPVTVLPGSTLTVSNSTFSGGQAGDVFATGAIQNSGTLIVSNSTFSGNTGDEGGTINNSGTATVTNSTFTGNNAQLDGGAIENTGTLNVSNSTFSGNSANTSQGEYVGGAIANTGTLAVSNSTISGNKAQGGDGLVGGIATGQMHDSYFTPAGKTTLTNTILAGNTDGGNSPVPSGNCLNNGSVDNGGNFSTDDSCGFTQSSSTNNATNLLLAPLASNGGPTQTIALLPGSQAIDSASCTVSTDQRGASRPAPGHTKCSSGAFEYGAITPVPNPVVTNCAEAALRNAISSAAPDSTVTFTCSGTITLTSGGGGPITLSKNVTIDGTGHTVTISGGGAVRVFVIPASSGLSVSLKNLTIANGDAAFPLLNAGGINNGATLSVTNSTFSGNSGGLAGAINNTNTGTLSVANSTFSGNSGGLAGAILTTAAGNSVTVTNSTFNGNSASGNGGVLYITNQGKLNVTNSTFSGNGAGAISNNAGTVTLANTILAGSSSGKNCAGSVTDSGGNLSDDNTCSFGGSSKNSATGLNLGPLADNGGPTQTLALLPGSAAIGAGLLSVCNAAPVSGLDQRGSPRSFPGTTTCDSGAYETFISGVAGAFAQWNSDGGVDAGFLQLGGATLGGSLGTCADLKMIHGDFNGNGLGDALVYCPSTGDFAKWYGTAYGAGPQFVFEPTQHAPGAPGAWNNVVMIPADFNGDGKTDILVYRPSDGAFAKWYSDGGVDAGFQYQATEYVGGTPGAWSNVAMVPADFNGDGNTDILVYRTNDGAFAKWYSDGGVDAGFKSQAVGYVGGAPGAWSNVTMVPADFNGDGNTDILVYRSNDGAFAKWYSDGGVDAGFQSQVVGYVAGAPGAWTNVTMVPADFNGDGNTDILVYRSNDGAFAKWYSDGGVDAGFQGQVTGYVAGAPGAWTNVVMMSANFSRDSNTDVLVYHSYQVSQK